MSSQLQQVGVFSDLPEELFILVLAYVPAVDLWRSRSVCKLWNALTRDPFLWRQICERLLNCSERPKEKSWEWFYMAKRVVLKGPGNHTGVGAYIWENGDRYEGEWNEGKRHGRGICRWADGRTYDGEWKEGKVHGTGIHTWSRGDKYEGQWTEDHMTGVGLYIWPEGDRYNGDWNNMKRQGWCLYMGEW